MPRFRLLQVLCLPAILTACTGIVFDSDTTMPRQLQELTLPGGGIASVVSGEGMQPDVSFDWNKVAFVREDSVTNYRQVFVMELGNPGTLVRVTDDSVDKSYPRWSRNGRLAFKSGSNIVVLNPDYTPFSLGSSPPQTDGGLDFFDDGNILVYERDDNLHMVPLDGSAPEMRLTNCNPPTMQCNFPIASHDHTMLAYHVTVPLGPGWLEAIQIMAIGTSNPSSLIMMGPALGGGGKIHSYDFSPGDDQMYVAAKPFDPATASYADEFVLFVVNLDGSDKEQLSPSPSVRYPSTRRKGLF